MIWNECKVKVVSGLFRLNTKQFVIHFISGKYGTDKKIIKENKHWQAQFKLLSNKNTKSNRRKSGPV